MKYSQFFFLLLIVKSSAGFALSAYDFDFTSVYGKPMPLAMYQGNVLLVVNSASKCGFTPQFKALQTLYHTYHQQGLEIIAVPSKDFGNQEFEAPAAIADFATKNYAVSFPLTELNHVSGTKAHPFYRWAYSQAGSKAVPKWNFHKLLINRNGQLVDVFNTSVSPMSAPVIAAVEKALSEKPRAPTNQEE